MTFDEASEAILSAPGIEWGFLTHTQRLVRHKAVRQPGGADAWIYGQRRSGGFRVVIATDKELADFERNDLPSAVSAAFEKLHLSVPEKLKELTRQTKAA